MKRIFFFLAVCSLAACTNEDQKTVVKDLAEPGATARVDSASLTTIEWLDSTSLSLGKVSEGKVVEVTYRFRNSGKKPLVFENVSASCGCTVPEKPEKPYAPGEEGVIKAKFDSKGRPHGEAHKMVYVDANTSPKSTQLSFRVEITD